MSTRSRILAACIALAALVAVSASAYLAWKSIEAGAVAGCTADGTFDCESVLGSRWSRWLGVPVAAFGSLVYLGIGVVAWPAAVRPRGTAMSLLIGLAVAALAAGLWFIGLQVFDVQSLCFYCLIVHCCGLVIGGLTAAMYVTSDPYAEPTDSRTVVGVAGGPIPSVVSSRRDDEPAVSPLLATGLAVLGMAILVGGQLLLPGAEGLELQEIQLSPTLAASRPADESDEVQDDTPDFMENKEIDTSTAHDDSDAPPMRRLSFVALSDPVDPSAVPLLGSPDATYVMVEMLDYTCPHCRQLHTRIKKAREVYGEQLAIALFHVPLGSDCNDHLPKGRKGKPTSCEYARLAIMVWQLVPEEFPAFHDWLMEGRQPPSVQSARKRALQLAGDRISLDQRLNDRVTERIRRQCDAWSRITTNLPVLLFENAAVGGGGARTDEELIELLHAKMGIEPVTAE